MLTTCRGALCNSALAISTSTTMRATRTPAGAPEIECSHGWSYRDNRKCGREANACFFRYRIQRFQIFRGVMMSKEQFPVTKTDEEWRRLLTPEQYAVLRGHGTESPGSCALLSEHREGTFSCAACDQPLFVGERKFESGTGWPSFFAPLEGSIGTTDRSRSRDDAH